MYQNNVPHADQNHHCRSDARLKEAQEETQSYQAIEICASGHDNHTHRPEDVVGANKVVDR
jgi:hypothetical protein